MAGKKSVIVVAEDDSDDRLLITDALKEVGFPGEIQFADDGVQLIDRLVNGSPLPSLVLLDLNMPRKDGRKVLEEMKSSPRLRSIPVIVHSTSNSEEDIRFCYDRCVNSYVVKPDSYEELRENLRGIVLFWFKIARLPSTNGGSVNLR
jgi:two-component system response regulator